MLSEDVSEEEVRPPNGSDEQPDDRREMSGHSTEEPPPEAVREKPAEKPSPRATAAAREAAKRALLSDPKKQDAKPNPLLDSRGPDFYDRRAKGLLETEHGEVELHPLMQAHPGDYVVVCTGGCPTGKSAEIVSIIPKRYAPPNSGPGAFKNNAPPQISCVGGCGPKGPSAINAAPEPDTATPIAATIGEWMTTVATVPAGDPVPMPKSSGGSGEWMEKIKQDRIAAEAKEAAASAPAKVETNPPAEATAKPQEPSKPSPDALPESKQAVAATAMPSVEAKPVAPAPAAPAVKPDAVANPVSPPAPVPSVEAPTSPAQAVVATEPPQSVAPASADAQPKLEEMAALDAAKSSASAATSSPPSAAPTSSKAAGDAAPAIAAQSASPSSGVIAAVSPTAVEKPAAAVPPAAPKDGVISVLSEDKEMNAAIEKARGSIGVFWKSYDGPAANETDHALKVAIAGNGTTEHFWLTRIRREGDKFSGVISNRPQSVTSVKLGQRYEFTAEMVSDWTFKRNGKLVGNETMRALLPRMPEEQAAVYRQMYEMP